MRGAGFESYQTKSMKTSSKLYIRDTAEGTAGQELSPVAFSRFIASLIRWNLIQEEPDPGNDQEKLYSITPDGELALFVYSARMKKRSVASTPGLT
jgi:hypothetical protein